MSEPLPTSKDLFASDEGIADWKFSDDDKILHVQMTGWRSLLRLFTAIHGQLSDFVWRGQRSARESLLSVLDRGIPDFKVFGDLTQPLTEMYRTDRLEKFKDAALGLRGSNPRDLHDVEWWALGRHYGLESPLLDWTRSPMIALFFAFLKETKRKADEDKPPPRGVFGLNSRWFPKWPDREAKTRKDKLLVQTDKLTIVTPRTDENRNLVSQAGLFTLAPVGVSVEELVAKVVPPKSYLPYQQPGLIMMEIPDGARDEAREGCLTALSKMNITTLALFPDLYGAAEYCNMKARLLYLT
ncbi:MAG: FRG domain-containing protein [Planctomycetota bacterium]|nr:FRG domain-containing protein [Planctomycetota bacterium]